MTIRTLSTNHSLHVGTIFVPNRCLAHRALREPRRGDNAIYFCLDTADEERAVSRRLVEELDDPDWNNSGRAAWGLTYGVADEAKALVEEGLLEARAGRDQWVHAEGGVPGLARVATEKSRDS